MRIDIDRAMCMGAGRCAEVAPRLFAAVPGQPSEVIDHEPGLGDRLDAQNAAQMCPVGAVTIEHD